MFNSISDWIKLPQQVQMPTVNMPKMPDIFGMNKKEGEQGATGGAEGENQGQAAAANMQQESQQQQQQQQQQAADPGASTSGGGETGDDHEKKMKMPIDIDASKAIGQAKELGTNIGNMLFNFGKNASSNVMKTATHLKDVIEKTSIIGDFTDENQKFVNEKKNQQRREEAAVPPWVGYNEEDKMKEQIMELSTNSRNFLRSPPDGVDFNFDYSVYYPIALATLEEDSNLKAMRFKLVPAKISEENFWRNYFYRVSLIKQSTQLSELSESNNLDDPDWDKELPEDLDSISAEELEKEINQMIGKE